MDATIAIQLLRWFVAGCVSFSAICVAVGWLIKIVREIRKPKEDIDAKLKRDYDRLNDMEATIKEFRGQFDKIDEKLDRLEEMNMFLLENDIVGFEHMRTNNATGKIAKRENDLQQFLLHKNDK